MAEADVLVAMPVFRGVDHLPETLRSVREQTYPHWRALVSVDGGDTASYEVCRAVAAEDPRFEVVLQDEQLGWPGNFNWVVARCELPFVTYWQQDDLASTGYLAALRAALLAEPEASLAFTDVQWFGDRFERASMPAITGSPLERVLQQFEWTSYIPLRGLIRAAMLDDREEAIRVTGELASHEEFVMLSRLAARGPFVHVADAMSFKRAHPAATTNRMYERPLHRRHLAWSGMGARTLQLALGLAAPEHHGRLLATILDRLAIARPGRGMFFEVEQSPAAVREMALALAEQAGIDLADDRWTVEPGTGLERPIHPLVLQALDAERERAAQLRAEQPPLPAFLGRGWWEPEEWGAWSREHATVELGDAAGEVRLEGRVFAPDGPVRVGWSLDGEAPVFTEAADGEPVVVVAGVPPGTRRLHLHLPDARSPADADVSPDGRTLGFGLERVRRG
jgi:hypothetical protein